MLDVPLYWLGGSPMTFTSAFRVTSLGVWFVIVNGWWLPGESGAVRGMAASSASIMQSSDGRSAKILCPTGPWEGHGVPDIS